MVLASSWSNWDIQTLISGVTANVHGFTVCTLGPRVERGVNLVDCNTDGEGGHIATSIYQDCN